MPSAPPPEIGRFDQDLRVHVDKTTGQYRYEDDETHEEFEWSGRAWVPVLDDSLIRAQQAAYSVDGVDENTPAAPVLAREERRKRKADGDDTKAPKAKRERASGTSAPKKTAVFVSNLPPTATREQLASVFSKAGVLLPDDEGNPRIKMYTDEKGQFKGEALVMYFKEGSVDLAITLLDDTQLELGSTHGNMRVVVADYDKSKTKSTATAAGATHGDGSAATAAVGEKADDGADKEKEEKEKEKEKKKQFSAEDKRRLTKRMRNLESKLAWNSGSDSDTPGPSVQAPSNRFSRVVVLKGMFVPEQLEKEPELILELKEDVREEAESLGTVTSVVLYDKEEDGVMTVKFKDAAAAEACVKLMDGRYFDKRRIYAGIYTGKERYRKHEREDDDDEAEQDRLDSFADWLGGDE